MHGVTTVIGGNCGFTLAPLRPGDADYLRKMMAKVEGMPLAALEQGTDWGWETLRRVPRPARRPHRRQRRLPRRPLRDPPLRDGRRRRSATRPTPEQIELLKAELGKAIEAGAIGFCFTNSTSHSDGEGQPVASRWATPDEMLALCEETGQHPGTTLEGIVPGCLDQFADDEIELLAQMSAVADRPLNWNVLTVDSRVPERVPRQLAASDRADELGGRVVALTMPVQVPMNMSFLNFCGLWLIPGWQEVLGVPVPERIERLRDADTRLRMLELSQSPAAGVFRRLADLGDYMIGDTYSDANEGLKGRIVARHRRRARRSRSSARCSTS